MYSKKDLSKAVFTGSAALLMVTLACIGNTMVPTPSSERASLTPGQITETATPPGLAADQALATVTPPAASVTPDPGALAITGSYPLSTGASDRGTITGFSVAVSPGKVWVGTNGIIYEVDSQSGVFGRSISLISAIGESAGDQYPIMKLGFEGQYLWAWAWALYTDTYYAHHYLFAIDTDSGEIVRQWNLESPEWVGSLNPHHLLPEDFGISPGRIWIAWHVIDAQSFEVKTDITMPNHTRFAYNGAGWLWMTGDTGGPCDNLDIKDIEDPTELWCPEDWPFLEHSADGYTASNAGSPIVLAEDRMWFAGGWPEGTMSNEPVYVLVAFPIDWDHAKQATEPLASVPLVDTYQNVRLLYAGDYLWLLYTDGEYAGHLYQLDPQTGATITSLDLLGDDGRSREDLPSDMVSDGDHIWVLTKGQLLRIKIP